MPNKYFFIPYPIRLRFFLRTLFYKDMFYTKPIKIIFISILLLLFFNIELFAYPLISSTTEKSFTYQQFLTLKKDSNAPLTLFEYTSPRNTTLSDVGIQFNVSLDTLLTISRSGVSRPYKKGESLILPTKNGIFMAVAPKNDIEFQINTRLWHTLKKEKPIIIRSKKSFVRGTFYFFADEKLTKLEQNTWNITHFRLPVLQGIVSSGFGYRISPISGKKLFHRGIDIAAKSGSQIFASKNGTITKDGYHSIYGYYIVIKHDSIFSTLYGHLLEKTIDIGDYVYAGTLIGYMGSTGTSTGTHVHFEIQKNGTPQNPLILTTPRQKAK